MDFVLHQRYTSETEPELGIGIVTETSKTRVKLDFGRAGEVRMYAANNAPLRRIVFKEGDTLTDLLGREMLVERVEERDGLFIYFGQGRILPEQDLGEMTVQHGPDDRLLAGDVDSPQQFSLRRRTLEMDYRRRISPVLGFVGGRIDLIPHQLYIAGEVSSRFAPRVLLSDEVGLGKTIEACLILHRLLLTGRASRVLVLVPESLVHQWFVELLRRFSLWFHIYDEERCESVEAGAPNGNPFLENQLILTSVQFLAGNEKRAAQAVSAGWDMLVVDEAHHLEWSVGQASPAYRMVEALGQRTDGMLLLTATPEQIGAESHFARLRLLDPSRYTDFEAFQQESLDQKRVADVAMKLEGGTALTAEEKAALAQWVRPDWESHFDLGTDAGRHLLIQDLLDQYGPGRVIFRNRRTAMEGFPSRIAHLVPLQAEFSHDFWLERMQEEFVAELRLTEGTLQRKSFQFERDPRIVWLAQFLESVQPAKVLLICNAKQKVLALEKALAEHISLKSAVFHEDLTLVQRDRYAAWFSEPDGARLLMCSEIGSEGRNFQFAHHLVLFDLPLQPEVLEQRIGRLDRIGQREDIHIHVPYLKGSPQELLVRWYHEGLNAFEKNLEAGYRISQEFGQRLRELVLSPKLEEKSADIEGLLAETRTFQTELLTKLATGRDRLLEMNSFRPEKAKEWVDLILAEDQNGELEGFMLEVFDEYGLNVEDFALSTYGLYAHQGNAQNFPSIPDEGMTVTFDRKRALTREEVGFLTWDHPMVTGAFDLVLGSSAGNASFAKLKAQGASALYLEAIFVVETAGESTKAVDRFLPRTPIRIIVDHLIREVTEHFPTEQWDLQLREGFLEDQPDAEGIIAAVFPKMLAEAQDIAESKAMRIRAQGLRSMNQVLDHEIERLEAMREKNSHVRQAEIDSAKKEQKRQKSMIVDSTLRLDAVQLVEHGNYFGEIRLY